MTACNGCGQTLGGLDKMISLGPSLTLWVCKVYNTGRAKQSCLSKALLKATACPGCGASGGASEAPALCGECRRSLELGRREAERLRGAGEEKLTLVAPYSRLFAGQGGVGPDEAAAIGRPLCAVMRGAQIDPRTVSWGRWGRMICGKPPNAPELGPTYAFEVPLDDAAAAAVDGLLDGVGAVVGRARREGFRSGSSVLHRLAVGNMSVTAFEEETLRRGPLTDSDGGGGR